MAELERDDAVTAALAELGAPEPLRTDDLLRAEGTLRSFHETRRRRTRTRVAWIGGATAMAAVLVLGLVTVPRLRGISVEVTSGAFVLQQDRLDAGASVPAGEWMEVGDARACLRVGGREACGEPGARLRVRDDGAIELERGRVRVERGIAVSTTLGELASTADALEIELLPANATLTVHEGAATLTGAGTSTELGVGSHTLAFAAMPTVHETLVHPSTRVATPPPDDDEPVITGGDEPSTVVRRSSPRAPESSKALPSAGEMLAAARDLATAGKLDAAARAYQKLIETHASSSEARAALVSLGRVQASRGRSSAALAAFEAYIAHGGGALSEEAHWGRISALHALGRTAERDRAIDTLAAKHPRSVYLAKARKLAQ